MNCTILVTSAELFCAREYTVICWRWPARHSTNQFVDSRRTHSLLCRTFSLEPSSCYFKKHHTFSLVLDATRNISTSLITSALSAFQVILQLMHYTNYLLTYFVRNFRLFWDASDGLSRWDVTDKSTSWKYESLWQEDRWISPWLRLVHWSYRWQYSKLFAVCYANLCGTV